MGNLTSKGKYTIKVGNHPPTNMVSKLAILTWGEYKRRTLELHLKLRDQQLKTILYVYRLLYQNLMVTSNQKSTIDIYTKKKKSNTTLKSHQITREQKRKVRKKTYRNKSKTTNKMAIRPYIWVITLNVNGSNVPTERHTLAEWIQKQDQYICCLQETHFRPRDTYTDRKSTRLNSSH